MAITALPSISKQRKYYKMKLEEATLYSIICVNMCEYLRSILRRLHVIHGLNTGFQGFGLGSQTQVG